MNDVRNLKIALVSVFVLGAVFAGYNAFKYSELNNKVADFNNQIVEAKTEIEAKNLITYFASDTATTSGALTTFAKKDGGTKKNGECSFKLFGICFSRYQNQPEGDGSGETGGPTQVNNNGSNNPDTWYFNGGYEPDVFDAGSAGAGAGTGSGTGSGSQNDDIREYCGPASSDC